MHTYPTNLSPNSAVIVLPLLFSMCITITSISQTVNQNQRILSRIKNRIHTINTQNSMMPDVMIKKGTRSTLANAAFKSNVSLFIGFL